VSNGNYRAQFHIYREYYQGSPLADIWDKIIHVLEEHGMEGSHAEYTGLLITEWIRTTWGGLLLVERHIGDSKEVSRFDQLRDRAVTILAEVAPDLPGHGPIIAEIVRVVRIDYRGKYITKIKSLDQLQRDHEIWSRANTPAQMEQMAIEHGISVVRAYQINKVVQQRKDKRDQPMLPGVTA